MDPITLYGYPPGDGATGRIGGVHGDRLYITIIIHSGGLTDGIILYVLHTEYTSGIECTDRIERLL
jgi:hypothetical protein